MPKPEEKNLRVFLFIWKVLFIFVVLNNRYENKFYIQYSPFFSDESQAGNSVIHLIDLTDSSSFQLPFTEDGIHTNSVFQFAIGIDSTTTMNTQFTGALDPGLGMYWAWNTGYIQIKISGVLWTSIQSFPFEYHLGGYRHPYITHYQKMVSLHNRTVHLSLEGFLSALPIQGQPKIMMPGPRAWTLYQHFVSSFP